MEKIIFECEIITPMFLAGANQSKVELRPPSIKGAMRYWWRAMHGNISLIDLKEKETKIFGGGGESAKKSRFTLSAEDIFLNSSKKSFPLHNITQRVNGKKHQINILDYLAYGVNEYQKEKKGQVIIRDYFQVGSKFNVIFHFDPILSENEREEIINSFLLVSLIGGLGSKSRNGFGRFKILNDDRYSYEQLLKLIFLFSKNTPHLNNWLTLSKETKIFKLKDPTNTWDSALAEIGRVYKNARDKLEKKHFLDKRQYLGAPLSIKNGNKLVKSSKIERHSKTHFLTVIKENEKYNGVIISLKYNFMENSEKKKRDNRKEQYLNVIDEFNGLLANDLVEV